MNAEQWVESFAGSIGADPPDAGEVEAILDLAAVAAHASALRRGGQPPPPAPAIPAVGR